MPKETKFFALFALGLLGSCSGTDAPTEKDSTRGQEIFSAEDKRVARALSIGVEGTSGNAPPQYQATLCSLALASVQDRMMGTGILSDEQQLIFTRAQTLYKRRAAAGLAIDEREQMRSQVEAAYPNQSDRARFAIGCLRSLA